MGYEIYTSGEVTITPALQEEFLQELEAFTRRDLTGETPLIPFPVDAGGQPRLFCDWDVMRAGEMTMLAPDQPAYIGWVDWLTYLVTWINSRFPDTHQFGGPIYWEGDDSGDRGRVLVGPDGAVAVQEEIAAIYEGSPEAEWHEAVGEYFRKAPPQGLGRILTVFTEHDLAVAYVEAACVDCATGDCTLTGDEHDLSVYWDVPQETRDALLQRARNALGASTMSEAAADALLSVVEEHHALTSTRE